MEYVSAEKPQGDPVDAPSSLKGSSVSLVASTGEAPRIFHALSSDSMAVSVPSHTLLQETRPSVVGGGGAPQLSTSHPRSATISFRHLQGVDAGGGLSTAAAPAGLSSSGGGRRPPGLEEEDGAQSAGPSPQNTLLVHSLSGAAVTSSTPQHLHPAVFSFQTHGATPLLTLGSASTTASSNVSLQHQQLQQLHQLRQQHSSNSTLLPLTTSPLLLGTSAGNAPAAAPSDLSSGAITATVSPHSTGLISSHFSPHPHSHAFLSAAPQHPSWLSSAGASFDTHFGSVAGSVAAAPAFASSSFSFSPSSPSVSTTAEAAALAAAIAAVKVEPDRPTSESEALRRDVRPDAEGVAGRSAGEGPVPSEGASSSESGSAAGSKQSSAIGAGVGECGVAMPDIGGSDSREAGTSGKTDSGVLLSVAPGFGTATVSVADPGRPAAGDLQASPLSDVGGADQGQLPPGGVATQQVHVGSGEVISTGTLLNSSSFSVRPSVVPSSLGPSFSSFPTFPSPASALAAAAVESLAALAAAAAAAEKATAKAAPSKRPRGRPKGSKDRAPRSRSGACAAGTEGGADGATSEVRSSSAPATVSSSANVLVSAPSAIPEVTEHKAVSEDRQVAKRRRTGAGNARKKKVAEGLDDAAPVVDGGLSDSGGGRGGDAPVEDSSSETAGGQLLHPRSAGRTPEFPGTALEPGEVTATLPPSGVFDSSGVSTAATSSSDNSPGDGPSGGTALTSLPDVVSHGVENTEQGRDRGGPPASRGDISGERAQAETCLSPPVAELGPAPSGSGLQALCDAETGPSRKEISLPVDLAEGADDNSQTSKACPVTPVDEDRPGGESHETGCAEEVAAVVGDTAISSVPEREGDEGIKAGSEDRNRARSRPPLSGEAVAWCGLGMVRAGGIRRSYSASFKLAVVAAAEGMNSNTKAAKQMGVTESLVRRWRMQKNVLEQLPGEKLSRRGRKHGKYVSLEQQLCLHVCAVQQQEGRILKDTEMRRLASEIAGTLEVSGFKASSTWCFRFKRRWGLDRVQATAAAAAAAAGVEDGAPSSMTTVNASGVGKSAVPGDAAGKPGTESGCEDANKTSPVVGAPGTTPAPAALCGEDPASSSCTQQEKPATLHQEADVGASLEIVGNGGGGTGEGVPSGGVPTVLVGSGASGGQQQDQLQQQLQQQLHQLTNGGIGGGPESVIGGPLLPQQLLGSQHLLNLEQHQLQHLQLQLHLQQPLGLQDPLRPSLRPPTNPQEEEDGSVVLLTPEQQQQQAALEQRLIELQKQQEELERQIEQHRLHQQFDAQPLSHAPPPGENGEGPENVDSSLPEDQRQLLFRQQLLLQQHQQLLVHQQHGSTLGLLAVAGFSPSSGTGAGHGNETTTDTGAGVVQQGSPGGATDGGVQGREGSSMGETNEMELKSKNAATAAAAVAAFLPQHLEEAAAAAFAAYGTTQQLHRQVHVDARGGSDSPESLGHDVQGSGVLLAEQRHAAAGRAAAQPLKGGEDPDLSQSQARQANVLGDPCSRDGTVQSETSPTGAFDEQQQSLQTQHAHQLQQQTLGLSLTAADVTAQRLRDQRSHRDSEGLGGVSAGLAGKARELECS